MIHLIVLLYFSEWALFNYIEDTQSFLLLSKYLLCSFLSIAWLVESKSKKLLHRSIIALISLDTWIGFLQELFYQLSYEQIDLSLYIALLFLYWFIFTLKRKYPEHMDNVNHDNINIMIMKPKSSFDVIKGLVGCSASSICIIADNMVWCYRRKSGVFEKQKYDKKFLLSHIVIDTKIKCNNEITQLLNNIIGTKRFPYIKCVWSIRHVLNRIGGQYKIKSWLDYIPSIYSLRIIKLCQTQ